MSDITRSEAIKTLKEHLSHWERLLQEHICEEQEGIDTISALKLAIASLEPDEAYQLEYERTTKNSLGVDAVSRKAVDDALYDYWHDVNIVDDSGLGVYQDSIDVINGLPPVIPQELILDKIRAEVLEYIDDLDIAYEICGVFDKYKAENEDKENE